MENSYGLGTIIKNARIQTGLSLEDLAKSCNLTFKTLYYIEMNKTEKPHLNTLVKLDNKLNLDLQTLLEASGYIINTSEEDLANIIKNARQKAGLTQMDLANLANLSPLEIASIEKNKIKKISLRTSEKLATALNLDLQKLASFVSQIDTSKALGTFIQKARLESGLSYTAFAKLCGLSKTQIRILEQNKIKNPHWSTIIKLSQIDTVNLQELKKICGYD